MGLYRKARPGELVEALRAAVEPLRRVVLSEFEIRHELANKSAKRGRPIVSTGDPAKDKRNAQQRELMRKRRAAEK